MNISKIGLVVRWHNRPSPAPSPRSTRQTERSRSSKRRSEVGTSTETVAEDFRVQDGLIFNAVQPGDKVSFTVVDKDGVKTITELRKQ